MGDSTRLLHSPTARYDYGDYSFSYDSRPRSSAAERLMRDLNAPWNSIKWRIDLPSSNGGPGGSGGRSGAAMPQFSSLRVQKAYRLNEIEALRLRRRLQILDSQRLHADRLVNQDIRLTRGALEHIESSTGSVRRSDQPIAATATPCRSAVTAGASASSSSSWSSSLSAESHDSVSELSPKPMFLYGERQVSRKINRYRGRSLSAAAFVVAAGADWRRRKETDLDCQSGASTPTVPNAPSSLSLPWRRRAATGVPLFQAIREKVERKISENPDYDPNADLSSVVVGFADSATHFRAKSDRLVLRNGYSDQPQPVRENFTLTDRERDSSALLGLKSLVLNLHRQSAVQKQATIYHGEHTLLKNDGIYNCVLSFG